MMKRRLAIPTLFFLAVCALLFAGLFVSWLAKMTGDLALQIPALHLAAIASLVSLALMTLTIHNRRLFSAIAILSLAAITFFVMSEKWIKIDFLKDLSFLPALGLLLMVLLIILSFFAISEGIYFIIIIFPIGLFLVSFYNYSRLSSAMNELSPTVIPAFSLAIFLIILSMLLYLILPVHKRAFVVLSVFSLTIGILLAAFSLVSQLIKINTSASDPMAMILSSLVFLMLVFILYLILLFLSKYKTLSYFRYTLLWTSRLLGDVYRFLDSGWRTQVVRLADIAFIALIFNRLFNPSATSMAAFASNDSFFGIANIVSSIAWEKILVIWFLFEILRFAWNSSQRLVIEESIFINESDQQDKNNKKSSDEKGKEESKPSGELASLLAVKLNRINELYQVVDEKRAIRSESGAGKPIDATIKTLDISEILKSSASDSSTLSLGPIKIPMVSVTSLIGRLMQGPRIIVSLHNTRGHDGNKYFYLTASMTGQEQRSWVVSKKESLDEDSDKHSIEDLVDELAHRIFAKLAFEEPGKVIPWRAVWRFNEGLRSYKDCLHTEKNRQYYLKKAEMNFIETVEEDSDFVHAYYNLGVVYTELKHLDSAAAAFYKAIEKNPNGWEAYYALGLNIIDRTRICEEIYKACGKELEDKELKEFNSNYDNTINLCKRVIDLKQKEASFFFRDYSTLAKVHDLMGIAQKRKAKIDCKVVGPICCSSEDVAINRVLKLRSPCSGRVALDSAIDSSENAVNYSWLALFHAEFWGDNTDSFKSIVSECIIDLAELYLYKYRQISRLNENKVNLFENRLNIYAARYLEQAIYLKPSDSNLYLWLGKAYCSIKGSNFVDNVYLPGARIAPEDSRFWSCISCQKWKDKHGKSQECNGVVSDASRQDIGQDIHKKHEPKALQAINKYLSLGMEKYCEANEIAIRNVFPKEHIKILMRTLFLAKLEQDVKSGGAIIQCLEKILVGKNSGIEKEDDDKDWKYALICISLYQLYKNLEWKNQCNSEGTGIDAIIGNAISKMNGKFQRKKIELSKIKDPNYLNDLSKDKHIPDLLEISQDLCVLGNLKIIKSDNFKEYQESYLKPAVAMMQIAYGKESEGNSQEGFRRVQYNKEYLRIYLSVGKLCMDYNPEASKEYFSKAMEFLEKEDPEEIKRSGLRSLLARSIRDQHEKNDNEIALKMAHKARLANPLGYNEHKELGRIFCSHEEYDYGLDELNSAYSWKPDDPEILVEMGKFHLMRAQNCYDKNFREIDLDTAAKKISQALEIYDRSQIKKRGLTRYWLGKVYLERGYYPKAIPHFKILHKLYHHGDIWLVATLRLAHAYLKLKRFDECEVLFSKIIDNPDNRNNCSIVGDKLDDLMYLREVFAWACIGKAFSFAERNGNVSFDAPSRGDGLRFIYLEGMLENSMWEQKGDLTIAKKGCQVCKPAATPSKKSSCIGRLNHMQSKDHSLILPDFGKAKIWIHEARDHINSLSLMDSDRIDQEDFKQRKILCLAACDDCMGWILYKQDYIDEAIDFLRNSVSRRAKAITYLHLALAYQRKMEKDDLDNRKKSLIVREALECCKHAERLDNKKEFSEEIKDLKKNLGEGKSGESSEDDGKRKESDGIKK